MFGYDFSFFWLLHQGSGGSSWRLLWICNHRNEWHGATWFDAAILRRNLHPSCETRKSSGKMAGEICILWGPCVTLSKEFLAFVNAAISSWIMQYFWSSFKVSDRAIHWGELHMHFWAQVPWALHTWTNEPKNDTIGTVFCSSWHKYFLTQGKSLKQWPQVPLAPLLHCADECFWNMVHSMLPLTSLILSGLPEP